MLDYTPVTLAPAFQVGGTPLATDVSTTTAYLPSRLTYPTGVNLRLGYNGYGQVTALEKWVPAITGQGSERIIARTSFGTNYVTDASPSISSRNENNENWLNNTVGWAGNPGGAYYLYEYGTNTATVMEPYMNGGTDRHIITTAGLVQTTTITGPGTDSFGYPSTITYKTIVNTFTKDTGVSYNANVRPITSQITDQASHTRTVGLSYIQQDGIWLVQNKDDYNGAAIYRRTTMSYTSYPAQRILGLPLVTAIYAGAGATLLAKTANVYDETGTYQDSSNQAVNCFLNAGATVQHDDTNYDAGFTARGNVTTSKQYATDGVTNRIVGRISSDTNGNVRHVADAAGNRKTIDLTDNFTNKPAGLGSTQAYVYTTADPIGTSGGAQYEYYTGLPTKSFILLPGSAVEQQSTTMSYDFADRPVQTTKPNGAWASVGYWDNLLRQTTSAKIDVISGVDQIVASFQDFDGAGRVIRKGSDHPNAVTGCYSGQKFKYDEIGRGVEQTNIHGVDSSFALNDGTWGWDWTHANLDALGRTTMVQKPDNTYIFSDYSVCGCAGGMVTEVFDERNNQKATEADFLGRLKFARDLSLVIFQHQYGNDYIDHHDLQRDQPEIAFIHFSQVGLAR